MIFRQTALLILAIFAFQISKSQTTLEEYNYVTKGYKIQLESGLDMKKGYKIVTGYSTSVTKGIDKRNIEVKSLRRVNSYDSSTTTIAAYILIYQLNDGPKEYLCVPHPNSDMKLKNSFLESIYSDPSTNASSRLQAIIYGLAFVLKW